MSEDEIRAVFEKMITHPVVDEWRAHDSFQAAIKKQGADPRTSYFLKLSPRQRELASAYLTATTPRQRVEMEEARFASELGDVLPQVAAYFNETSFDERSLVAAYLAATVPEERAILERLYSQGELPGQQLTTDLEPKETAPTKKE